MRQLLAKPRDELSRELGDAAMRAPLLLAQLLAAVEPEQHRQAPCLVEQLHADAQHHPELPPMESHARGGRQQRVAMHRGGGDLLARVTAERVVDRGQKWLVALDQRIELRTGVSPIASHSQMALEKKRRKLRMCFQPMALAARTAEVTVWRPSASIQPHANVRKVRKLGAVSAESWCRDVADARVHGATRKVPREVFEAEELPRLLALPEAPFDVPIWMTAKVHTDHHAQVARALYSAPSRYRNKKIEVRVDSTSVRLYYDPELVKVHPRVAPGKRSTDPGDYPVRKAEYALRNVNAIITRAPFRAVLRKWRALTRLSPAVHRMDAAARGGRAAQAFFRRLASPVLLTCRAAHRTP
ncbi:Mu transposase domain-containing protein [Sorangium sp. So ce887]|uniref:Mu transposase domain-containing protein n=1 Tax=Sorangium sp. So ce887 TaxID=3133324 RepID=UPI003F5F958B